MSTSKHDKGESPFQSDLEAFFRKHMPDAPFKALADVIEYNARNSERTMPIFGQDLLVKAEARGPLTSKEYRGLLERNRRLTREDGIDAVMGKFKLDALVARLGAPTRKRAIVAAE